MTKKYIPTRDDVDRMRKETGAGFYTVMNALQRARGDWSDAKRIIQYSGTIRIDAVLREIDDKHTNKEK